jgi:hypothetical protein
VHSADRNLEKLIGKSGKYSLGWIRRYSWRMPKVFEEREIRKRQRIGNADMPVQMKSLG